MLEALVANVAGTIAVVIVDRLPVELGRALFKMEADTDAVADRVFRKEDEVVVDEDTTVCNVVMAAGGGWIAGAVEND